MSSASACSAPAAVRRSRTQSAARNASVQIAPVDDTRGVPDLEQVREVIEVRVREDRSVTLNLLFDPDQNLGERILKEQFAP